MCILIKPRIVKLFGTLRWTVETKPSASGMMIVFFGLLIASVVLYQVWWWSMWSDHLPEGKERARKIPWQNHFDSWPYWCWLQRSMEYSVVVP